MGLFSSISGIAKEATGAVSGFRSVMNLNPGSIPFAMPPQVELGLAAARAVSEISGIGLKVPTSDELKKMATGELDLILKGVRNSNVLADLDKAQSEALEVLGSAEEVLNSIDWLL